MKDYFISIFAGRPLWEKVWVAVALTVGIVLYAILAAVYWVVFGFDR